MGPEVEAFEREFAAMIGARHALAVANGTAALHLSYLALDLGTGDEIIQPAINFVASANLSLMIGAHPVFADIVGLDEPTPVTPAGASVHSGPAGRWSLSCRRRAGPRGSADRRAPPPPAS